MLHPSDWAGVMTDAKFGLDVAADAELELFPPYAEDVSQPSLSTPSG